MAVTTEGKAAGRITWRTSDRRRAPTTLPALIKMGGTWSKPASTALATKGDVPSTTTRRMAPFDSPSSMAPNNGHTIVGIDWSPVSSDASALRSTSTRAVAAPTTNPITIARRNPSTARRAVTPSEPQKLAVVTTCPR
jgi:hypothetical protein